MTASDHLSPKQFTFVHHNTGSGLLGSDEHILDAFPKGVPAKPGNEAGYIHWHAGDDGRIQHIEVSPEYRRKGVGTALFNQATQVAKRKGLVSPKHHEVRTPEGDAWAKSVGGPVPALACGNCGDVGHYTKDCPQ